MLFNSYEFILAFLPVTLAVFLFLGSKSRSWALGWLILASLAFYAWWRPFNLAILLPSIVVNYALGRALLGLPNSRWRGVVLGLGIAFNIAVLGYFKYANFLVSATNDIVGTDFVLQQIILPLGLSFITFQKIAFLVDIAGGRIKSFTLRDYLLFVLFFPQLIAGPIVHYRESVPQFQDATCRFDATRFAVAITLFCFGLFKKVVLADGIAPYVDNVFGYAAAGGPAALVQSWAAAVGFTLQIYFDFSGYSDMACGAALFFGIRLPTNFDSPLKSANIVDFWLRWHMTLTRFLTAYIYNPLALAAARRRAAAGKPMLGARGSSLGAFASALAIPTITTMLISGVWHGAGYTFIIWGALHAVYLIVAHAWRQYGPGKRFDVPQPVGFALTFAAVSVAMVLFRAPDMDAAVAMLRGMVGLNGVGLPASLAGMLHMPQLGPMMSLEGEVFLGAFLPDAAWIAGLLAVALVCPNSLQVLQRYEPTLYPVKRAPKLLGLGPALFWQPSLVWFVVVAALAATAMWRLTGPSEFLYWQF